MNSLERALAAINLEKVDRVPTSLHNFEMCAKASGKPYGEYFTNGELMAEWQIKLWKRFKHDIIFHENGTALLAEAIGCKVEYRSDKSPVVLKGVLEDIEEVDKLKPFKIEESSVLKEVLKGTRLLVKELGSNALVMGRADQGPFSLAALSLGMDKFLMELALGEHMKKINQLMEYCTDVIIQYAQAQLEQGCLITSIGDSLAGPDVISPELYRTLVVPYEKAIADKVHEKNGLLSLHICGNANKIIGDMMETGADILEVDEKTDLNTAYGTTEGTRCLLGNISPALLRNGTPEEVRSASESAMEIMKDRRGFVLGPGCALSGDTPYENIDAMMSVI